MWTSKAYGLVYSWESMCGRVRHMAEYMLGKHVWKSKAYD